MPQPFVDRPDDDLKKDLMNAAIDGKLGLLKVVTKNLTKGNGSPSAIFSFNINGYSVLHAAACFGRLEICKYLVEELKGDVNAPGYGADALGSTPFMLSASSGDVATVKYFLDRGGDVLKADDKGRTVLHHAVAAGCCEVTEFLLSKGVSVDINYGCGTPAFVAAVNGKDNTLKILLDHKADPNIAVTNLGSPLFMALTQRSLKCMEALVNAGADVNCKDCAMSPLVYATTREDCTNFIPFLLKAGADPNIPDDLGRLPVELAAVRDCREEVQMLFPSTSPIPNVPNWSVEGVVAHAKAEDKKPMEPRNHKRRKDFLKLQAETAFKQKEYKIASQFYDMAICHEECATLYCNRSLCKLLMGDGKGALSYALRCRILRPDWAKACRRVGAAHMLLQEYEQARNAFLEAQVLDPGNAEIEGEIGKAKELMKNPSGEGEQ